MNKKEVIISGWIIKGENVFSNDEVEINLSSDRKGRGEGIIDLMIDAIDCHEKVIDESMGHSEYTAKDVFIRYYISNSHLTWEEAEEEHIKTLFGDLTMTKALLGYSEYSIDGMYHIVNIGGHNIEEELENYDGKYLVMKISYNIIGEK